MSLAFPRLHSVKRRTMEWRPPRRTPCNDGRTPPLQAIGAPGGRELQQSLRAISSRSSDRRRDLRS